MGEGEGLSRGQEEGSMRLGINAGDIMRASRIDAKEVDDKGQAKDRTRESE
jgi:hypothetical protein